tara:strand:+ start:449 stop:643 length:195 start_codon:yes stop_codon:yes gene_type:complete
MKKLVLILLCLPFIWFGQTTPIPDANFELALTNLGYETGVADGSVPIANILNQKIDEVEIREYK